MDYRFHSLHHTQFRTNYSLFVPFYDYLYGTMDKSSEDLYERTLHGKEEAPDVVHLTHLTTPGSLLHLRLGFASVASWPLVSGSFSAALALAERPLAVLASVFGRTAFRSESNRMGKLSIETWVVPRYSSQVYLQQWPSFLNSPNSYLKFYC
jgi:aldehyde decarbonylase